MGGSPRGHLFFIHGAWHNALCWQEHFFDYFTRRGFTVHAIDLRGHGTNTTLRRLAGARLRDYVADVARALEVRGLTDLILVGHSMGGLVAQSLLARHPEITESTKKSGV
jgi:pimeloyl-ACP methyl ester carboxylesterase